MEPQTQHNITAAATLVTPEASVDELQLRKVEQDIKQPPPGNPLLEEEMVIEEVSIDGMCGVY